MSTGVLLPAAMQGPGEGLTTFARRAEELGYDSLWLPEVSHREVIGAAGWLLGQTDRIRVGTAIASAYARDASTAAMAARTLGELSNGRFDLGLGVSIRWLVEQRGQHWEKPLAKAAAYLDAYHAHELHSPPPPSPVPLYFAAHGPRLVETVKDRVDGLLTINVPPDHTADVRRELGPNKRLLVIKTVVPETDPVAARERARETVGVYLQARQYWTLWPKYGFDDSDNVPGGSDRIIDMLVAWGDGDAIATQIEEYFEAGADEVIIRFPTSGEDVISWDLFEALAPGR
ncbi:MAG: LLM class flavin-dependent oxidoreductase [Acidimicrobiales bacterium]